MMLIKLFIFFLLLLILPDWYIYRAYIHRVSQKWIRRAYWIPTIIGKTKCERYKKRNAIIRV